MNKYLAMVIIKPDIREKRINSVQSSILNLFEQNTKVKKVWYLGKNKLDFKNKNVKAYAMVFRGPECIYCEQQ